MRTGSTGVHASPFCTANLYPPCMNALSICDAGICPGWPEELNTSSIAGLPDAGVGAGAGAEAVDVDSSPGSVPVFTSSMVADAGIVWFLSRSVAQFTYFVY